MNDWITEFFSIHYIRRGDETTLHVGYFWLFLIGYAACEIVWRVLS